MIYNPEKQTPGTICPALSNEDYDYKLSGDFKTNCICIITGKKCLGKTIQDPEDQSSQFFSRGRIIMVEEKLNQCPCYGISKDILKIILQERLDKENEIKLDLLK